MRALVVTPGRAQSGRLIEVPEPSLSDGTILVQTVAIGICGTDDSSFCCIVPRG